METFKLVGWIFLVFSLLSCKKSTELLDANITVEDLFIKSVKSDQINIQFKLSHLGYTEAGIYFYKKSSPQDINKVMAIREDNILLLSLQDLEAETEYIFNVFYKKDGLEVKDKDYEIVTLTKTESKFALEIKRSVIDYDEEGNFTIEIEGQNLNNLNLSDLDIRVGNSIVSFDYPTVISGNNYKIVVKGVDLPFNGYRAITAHYKGKDIFFQAIEFLFSGERYWLTFKPTTLYAHRNTVAFNNELYYFVENNILKWNDPDQRLQTVATGIDMGRSRGMQFGDQIFFPTVTVSNYPASEKYPQAFSYSLSDNKWTSYPFTENSYQIARYTFSNNLFIHNGELYLTYRLEDDALNLGRQPLSETFVYHYNKTTKQFEMVSDLDDKFREYFFISIKNQLYLIGLTAIYDQGLELSSTLCVYKVNPQNFELEEIYRGGTVHQPETIRAKFVTEFEQKILIAISVNNFLLFDPANLRLSNVYVRNPVSHTYLESFFIYNQKIHQNNDLGFYSQKVYEISITHSR